MVEQTGKDQNTAEVAVKPAPEVVRLSATVLYAADTQIKQRIWQNLTHIEGDSIEAFRWLVGQAIERRIDVVIGGDFFDVKLPDSQSILAVQEIVQQARVAGVTVCGIVGNHDLASPSWYRVCGILELGQKIVQFAGRKWWCLDWLQRPEQAIKAVPADCSGLIVHQLIDAAMPAVMAGSANLNIDWVPVHVTYILAGDYHERMTVPTHHLTFHYPGSTVLCNWGEKPAKFASIVSTGPDGTVQIEDLPIPGRKFYNLKVSTDEQLNGVIDEMKRMAEAGLGDSDLPPVLHQQVMLLRFRSSIEGGLKDVSARVKAVKPSWLTTVIEPFSDDEEVEARPAGETVEPEGEQLMSSVLSGLIDRERKPEAYDFTLNVLEAKDPLKHVREQRKTFNLE